MPTTRPKAVTIEWLEQHILPKLDDALRQDLEATLDEVKQLPTSLPAGSLNLKDAIEIFDLTYNQVFDAWAPADNELCEVPPLLVAIKNEYLFVTEGSLENEALARSQINDILIICIGEEKRLALREYNQPNAALSTQSLARPTTPFSDPAPLLLQIKTKLNRLVTYRKEKRILQGIADYLLWYDKDEPMGTNLVLIEAKREGMLSMANGQLVAYMGIVHRTRGDQGKQNKLVRKLDWKGGDSSRVVSYLRLVIRSAILSSPSTTPIKGEERRDVSLSTFRDPDKIKSFDYGIKRFNLPELGDDVDDDKDNMDIVDLSLFNSSLYR
ncbi:hypothetical protein MMC17_004633 [Xylographa soralifera]|nr:hypothetical protein [Xylographa soralifera]